MLASFRVGIGMGGKLSVVLVQLQTYGDLVYLSSEAEVFSVTLPLLHL